MYIVYVTLMNANMAVALFLLAVFIFRGIFSESARDFVPAFTLTGAVAVATGLHMVFTAPMPGSWNIAMGEPSVLMGVLLGCRMVDIQVIQLCPPWSLRFWGRSCSHGSWLPGYQS